MMFEPDRPISPRERELAKDEELRRQIDKVSEDLREYMKENGIEELPEDED